MATPTSTPPALDRATAERLSAAFHRCFSHFEVDDDVFTADALYDLHPPLWRFQLQGSGDVLTAQLRSIAEGSVEVEVEVLRTVPAAGGFVTEHVETHHLPDGQTITARRLHLCEVTGDRISAVTTYCNGGWDAELRARHAVEAPMVRP